MHQHSVRRLVLCCTLLIASLTGVRTSAQPVQAGIARDAKRGRPLECLHVVLLDSADKAIAHTVTDSAGRFFLEAPGAGAYRVQFRVHQWEPLTGPLDTLGDAEFRQRIYPLTFANIVGFDSTADADTLTEAERRRRNALAYEQRRASDAESGWSSRKPIPEQSGVQYPTERRRTRTSGRVLAWFIVDSTGSTRPSSWEVVSASDEEFAFAMKRASRTWKWEPARNAGRPVCELTLDYTTFDMTRGFGRIMFYTR
ncbi:MAG TPA: energy transducer TonB [Gemmatimonadaceae bacterium]|nr:energy transducer TonB [Gemmatimonadaceae bacterium]